MTSLALTGAVGRGKKMITAASKAVVVTPPPHYTLNQQGFKSKKLETAGLSAAFSFFVGWNLDDTHGG